MSSPLSASFSSLPLVRGPSSLRHSHSGVISCLHKLKISDHPTSAEEVLTLFEEKIATYTRHGFCADGATKASYVADTKRILIDNASLLAGEEILFCLFYLAILNASVDAQPPIHFIVD